MGVDPDVLPLAAPVSGEERVGGRYELREELGRGATARVWQAWDTLLQRMVALKVLDAGHANRAGLQRVLREARATSDVVSDYVVRVQGVSGEDAVVPYIDMELCAEFDGSGQRLLARPMSEVRPTNLREAVRWVIHAARGVHAAHQQGVFHRDLKPENILIRPASRRAQVTDFGLGVELSLLGEEARTARSTVSIRQQRKCIAGTPMYMAPEAAHGLEPCDPEVPEQRRTLLALDLYGLGAVLYELLANRPPYLPRADAENPLRDVLDQVRAGPPPSVRSWRSWFRRGALSTPRRLERILLKAMAREPRHRYRSALELAEDLDAFLTRRPTSLERDQWLLRLGLAVRRHQAALATLTAAALMAVILVGGGVIARGILDDARQALRDQREAQQATAEALRQRREAETARDLAVAARDEATRARDLAQADAGLRVLQAEQRAAAAEAEVARAAAREKAAHDSEAGASKRARELEVAIATHEGWRRAAEESERRATERLEQATAEVAQLKKQLASMTRGADQATQRAAELDRALALERSRATDLERELARVGAIAKDEARARAEAEGRATALLAEVERMRDELAALIAREAADP